MDPEREWARSCAHCTITGLHIHDGFARSWDNLVPIFNTHIPQCSAVWRPDSTMLYHLESLHVFFVDH